MLLLMTLYKQSTRSGSRRLSTFRVHSSSRLLLPPPTASKSCCGPEEADNPAKELLKESADKLAGTLSEGGGELDAEQLAAASKLFQLIQLVLKAKTACKNLNSVADACASFAQSPDVVSCMACCMGLYTSVPGIAGVAYFACNELCKDFQ
jgi:hypothetical protein